MSAVPAVPDGESDAAQAAHHHGALREGMHLATYSFERAMGKLEWLLDDDRWMLLGFSTGAEFLDSLQLDNLRMSVEQRKSLVQRLAELPDVSNRRIAGAIGVGSRTVDRDVGAPNGAVSETAEDETPGQQPDEVGGSAPNGAASEIPAGESPGRPVAILDEPAESGTNAPPAETAEPLSFDAEPSGGELQRDQQRRKAKTDKRRERDRAAEARAIREAPEPPGEPRLLVCGIETLASHVDAGSVDLVLTDPPYPKEFLPVWEHLARFAAHALKPGGALVAMSGQTWLPEVLAGLQAGAEGTDLNYRWCGALLLPGASYFGHRGRHHSRWKPLIVAAQGDPGWGGQTRDTFDAEKLGSANADDRHDYHRWGQDLSGWVAIQDAYSHPGDLVCDPFLGGGTAAVAAAIGGRGFVGADVSADCVETARRRLETGVEAA